MNSQPVDHKKSGLSQSIQKFLMPIAIVVSIVLGIIIGLVFGESAKSLEVLPKIFMWFIKNLTPFLIFLAVGSGILSIGSLEQLRRLGLKAGGIYMCTALFAVIIGITSGLYFRPGDGFDVPPATPIADTSFIDKILSSPLLSLVVMTILLSIATLSAKEFYEKKLKDTQDKKAISEREINKKNTNLKEYTFVVGAIEKLMAVMIAAAKVIFKGIGWVIWIAPLAVMGSMASLFSSSDSFNTLSKYGVLLAAFSTSIIFQFLVLALMIMVIGRLNPIPFFKKIWSVMVMGFSTSSSKATLPYAMDVMEDTMGASQKGARFILPLGATINMDGTAIYLGLCGVLFAQAYGIDLSMSQYLILAFTCTFGSIGAAGLPGGSFIFMPMVLAAVGIPSDGIVLIIAIDRILDMIRTMTNITGDCALALALDASEGNLNRDEYYGKPDKSNDTPKVNTMVSESKSNHTETW
ncbi:MAG: Na+/H+-dicarboxylate symporter [Alphaproteobacteria bacterium]|jgi:Na+/H+-dicarboxylate symporter